MKVIVAVLALSLLACVSGQGVGTNTPEKHPSVQWQQCTKSGCSNVAGSIVLDSNWRWTHSTQGSTNCYTGNLWDKTLCPDPQTCAKNCVVDGADYQGTYGIQASGSSVNIKFVTNGPYSKNIGSRVYLMNTDDSHYQMFKLLNREFTFDVDVSKLPCGLNGALYFVEMQADGGMSAHPTNKAGAKYGTGYCDAQCPHDMKWINGEANVLGWKPSPNDPNSGTGQYGTCCIEMDIWEANSISTAYTPHPCTVQGQYRCSGTQCGDNPNNRYGGVCDKDGCDLNTYRVGVKNFFGPQMTIDSTKPVTVVTQFLTTDGTDNGDLKEIRRYWVQNGKVIATPMSNEPNLKANSVTDQYCTAVKALFGDKNDFTAKGGMKATGAALKRGMVLVMSLWDDHDAHMLWLDSNYPTTKPANTPGVARGTCATTSGVPADVESQHPDANVTFMNIKFGAINSTFHS